ncbi:hypothetical protein R6Q57_018331 [Mikania cordata]
MFSNSSLFGMKTTLQFHEGRAPNGRKTDRVMQEYRTPESCDNDATDHMALCRVFLADECSTHCIADIDVQISRPTLLNENASDMDYILRGDYIELNDLIDPGSCSSVSADSSCLTTTSDEYFDPMALLQELDKHIIDQEMKDSSVKFNLSAPISGHILCHFR